MGLARGAPLFPEAGSEINRFIATVEHRHSLQRAEGAEAVSAYGFRSTSRTSAVCAPAAFAQAPARQGRLKSTLTMGMVEAY